MNDRVEDAKVVIENAFQKNVEALNQVAEARHQAKQQQSALQQQAHKRWLMRQQQEQQDLKVRKDPRVMTGRTGLMEQTEQMVKEYLQEELQDNY